MQYPQDRFPDDGGYVSITSSDQKDKIPTSECALVENRNLTITERQSRQKSGQFKTGLVIVFGRDQFVLYCP